MLSVLTRGIAPIWQISVPQYHAMIDKGILGPDDPIELLEGVLVQKMSKQPPHSVATRKTRRVLDKVIPPGWWVDTQEPITLDMSEPEPDVAVFRGKIEDYLHCHPGPADVGLIVEIADSSLDRDRIVKKRIYAAAAIPWYWIIDLNSRRVEVYSQPKDGDYVQCTVHEPHERIAVVLDGEIAGDVLVSDLIP